MGRPSRSLCNRHCCLQHHANDDCRDRRGRARRIYSEEPLRDVKNLAEFPWLKSQSSSWTSMSDMKESNTTSARDARKIKAGLQRTKSSPHQALKGLRFISKSTARGASHADKLCRNVEARFDSLAKDGWRSWARRRGLGLMFGI